ncbi:MAG TPA: ABC transporter permease subunit [Bacteroidota bacterium]|nr:ABC transporter permease subunit [Bacteroidota bacterium]
MFKTLVLKELKTILLSPKFAATFGVCSLLLLLSTYLGIREFRSAEQQYAAANELVQQEMREARQWMSVNNRIYRKPNPLEIFSAGIQNDIGRFSGISTWTPVKLVHSAYSDDPIFAVFRFIDVAFIIQVVFTLLAILFTYDAINGERETGTLQLTFSNAVSRVEFVAAKFAGTWLGLIAPLSIPLVLSLVLLVAFSVPLTMMNWVQLLVFYAISLLLVTFFVAYGLMISTLTRRSNVSFLFSLVSWVAFVLIIPRVGVMLAGQIVKVPTIAEIEGQQESFSKNRWDDHMKDLQKVWKERSDMMRGLSEADQKAKRDEMEWTWAEQDDALRKKVQTDIDENMRKLQEGARNKRIEQQRLAFNISRVSPVAAFQLAVMDLSETDISLKTRYEDALNTYRTSFNQFKDQNQKASGNSGGLRISFNSNSGLKVDVGREVALDLTGAPQFKEVDLTLGEVLGRLPMDIALLSLMTLLTLAGSLIAFLRYDVR